MKLSNLETNNNTISIFSPSDGELIAKRELADEIKIQSTLKNATQAQAQWQALSIKQRANYCEKAVAWFIDHQDEIAQEISQQMGRPIQFAKGEIKGLKERADYMISIAESALTDSQITKQRFIRRKALGNVFIIAPWNYPYLTAINSIIPALMAGNCVILKHASQTLLCAERFTQAFSAAGLPQGVFQHLHLNHPQTLKLMQQEDVHYVSFTGSVNAGKIIEKNLAGYFKPLSLELGGKDAAYVRKDANLKNCVESLVEGVFFNSGQSCCAVERIYVERPLHEDFIAAFIAQTKTLTLGHSLDPNTSLGPMINAQAVSRAQIHIQDALKKGAKALIKKSDFPAQTLSVNGSYLVPQVFSAVDHDMQIMTEESFAPIIGIMPVNNDQQAIELINDSEFGLTASIWTQDEGRFLQLSEQVQAGTIFMNRCDYLDPALPWSGLKNSGRGCSLSHLAYQQLTQSQAIHIRNEQ